MKTPREITKEIKASIKALGDHEPICAYDIIEVKIKIVQEEALAEGRRAMAQEAWDMYDNPQIVEHEDYSGALLNIAKGKASPCSDAYAKGHRAGLEEAWSLWQLAMSASHLLRNANAKVPGGLISWETSKERWLCKATKVVADFEKASGPQDLKS